MPIDIFLIFSYSINIKKSFSSSTVYKKSKEEMTKKISENISPFFVNYPKYSKGTCSLYTARRGDKRKQKESKYDR